MTDTKDLESKVKILIKDARAEYELALPKVDFPTEAEEHHDYMLQKWIMNLIAKERREAARKELEELNFQIAKNGWHKENAHKIYPYLLKRFEALKDSDV